MKKTICTLLALSACAYADSTPSLSNAALSIMDYDGKTSSYTGAFTSLTSYGSAQLTLLLVLDYATIADNASSLTTSGTSLVTLSDADKSGAAPGLALYTSSDENKEASGATMWNGSKSGSATGDYHLEDYASQGKVVLTLKLQETTDKASVLYISSSGNESIKWTSNLWMRYANYDTLTIEDSVFKDAIDSIYVFNSSLTDAQVISLSADAIAAAVPEPATATLSLLALAGLAARRRRK